MSKKEGEIAGKSVADYLKVIKLPVLVLVVWSVIQTAALVTAPMIGWALAAIGMLIGLVVFLYVGWSGIKTYKLDLAQCAVAGAITAVIAGIIGLILTIIVVAAAGTAVAGALAVFGAPASVAGGIAGGFVMSALILSGIVGLIIGAIVGAILAAIGAVIAQNVK